jgi:hypothetical protein
MIVGVVNMSNVIRVLPQRLLQSLSSVALSLCQNQISVSFSALMESTEWQLERPNGRADEEAQDTKGQMSKHAWETVSV